MSALYEGCWHKLDRAKKHLDELQSGVGAWTNPHVEPPYTFGAKFDAERNCFIFRVESVKAFPAEWGLIAGDVLTNLRASLDYLAYDLVGRGTTPHRRHETRTRTFFPIAIKKIDFKGQINGGTSAYCRNTGQSSRSTNRTGGAGQDTAITSPCSTPS
jgi:hypothetical protein